MPKIEDALNAGKKKFIPKRYRAWEFEPQAEQNIDNNEKKGKNLKGKQTVSIAPTPKGKQTVSNAPTPKGKQTVSNAPTPKGKQTVSKAPAPKGKQTVSNALTPKGKQTVSKAPAPKGKQTVSNAPTPKGKQTVSNAPLPKGRQTVSNAPLPKGRQTVSNAPLPKGKQTVSNAPLLKGKQTVSNATLTYSIESDFYQTAADRLRLVGIQKSIVDFLAALPLDDEGKTPPVNVVNLLKITGCNNTTLKNALTRLYAKEILFKGASKAGKGGFRIFKFSEEFMKLKAQIKEDLSEQISDSLKGKQKVSKR